MSYMILYTLELKVEVQICYTVSKWLTSPYKAFVSLVLLLLLRMSQRIFVIKMNVIYCSNNM